jgi:hypothetical protein
MRQHQHEARDLSIAELRRRRQIAARRTVLVGWAAVAVVLVTVAGAHAQITTSVINPNPVPCATQAGAPTTPPPHTSILNGDDMWCDADGLIVHEPTKEHPFGDGGDTGQREGWYWLGVWIRQNTPGLPSYTPRRKLNFDQVLRLLEPAQDGVFYRHPKLHPWNNPHGKEFGLSRDQMEPLVAAMGLWGKRETLRRLWDALPESALGKHSFNGSWVNWFNDGIAGQNCTEIQKRGCDATRDCSLRTDSRDCSLNTDTRDCSLRTDERSCGFDVCLFGGCVHVSDWICEGAKATQNALYAGEKAACEAAKATQNAFYAGEKAACEAAKATQNVLYKAEKDACELVKAGEKLTCEADKAAALTLCRLGNRHSGDNIGPMTVNLFRRAMGEHPLIPISTALTLPPVNLATGQLGETELTLDVLNRLYDASISRDETGKELNMIARLLVSAFRFPTVESETSIILYATGRPFSFGSYLSTYRSVYGSDLDNMKDRIADGIRSGWTADAPPVHGALLWYHRPENGGNPHLARLYAPIIDKFIYKDLNGTFSTQTPVNPPPTISELNPALGLPKGGAAITINGTGFLPGTTVLIDGVPATGLRVTGTTKITAVVPAHRSGRVDVSVTVPWPGGGTVVLDDGFTYIDSSSDLNGDGGMDLLWRHADGRIAGWKMNGKTLADGLNISPSVADPAWEVVATGDFNSDHKLDLLWQHRDGWLAAWLMNGGTILDGVMLTPNRVEDPNWKITGTADLNGDGMEDIIWQHKTQGLLASWLMNGTAILDGQLLNPNQLEDPAWKIAGTGDLNGDQKADIIFQHQTNGKLAVWYMNGANLADGRLLPNDEPDTAWRIAALGDLNGDGWLDLVWQHADGRLRAWLMQNAARLESVALAPDRVSDLNWKIVGPR